MIVGIAAGHSLDATPAQMWEHDICRRAAMQLSLLLELAEFRRVEPGEEIYDLDNDAAIRAKVEVFNRHKVDLAVELHLNAGGGDYSAIYWDDEDGESSTGGHGIASALCEQWEVAFPWRTIGVQPQSYFSRSLGFLNHTRMPAVIAEAGFKDNADQRAFFASEKGPVMYATSVFQGICRYAEAGV